MSNKINSREAYDLFKSCGVDISYPTAMKRIRAWGLFNQPTGRYGGIVVDADALRKAIKGKYKKDKAGRPKGAGA